MSTKNMYDKQKDEKKKRDAQTRLTKADCEKNQVELIELIEKNIRYNQPLSMKLDRWTSVINNAFMSKANDVGASISFKSGRVVILGKNLHSFALRMCFLKGKKIKIRDTNSGEAEVFDIADLWRILYNGAIDVFGYSIEESRNMSKERELRKEPTSYTFRADDTIR